MEKREYAKPSVVTESDSYGVIPLAAIGAGAAIASGGAAIGFLAGYAATRAVTNSLNSTSRALAARAVRCLEEMDGMGDLCRV